jgi:hypothetical protein
MRGQSATPRSTRHLQHEGVRVRQWRREQFYRLGFSGSDARTLARSGADLSTTRKLIADGCDPETVYRIVR